MAIRVTAHQWWWEVRYPAAGVVTANELHVPTSDAGVPRRVYLTLKSDGQTIEWLLRQAELTVSELIEIVGQSQPRVSRHLKLLGEAGLVESALTAGEVGEVLVEDETDRQIAKSLAPVNRRRQTLTWSAPKQLVDHLATNPGSSMRPTN